MIERELETALKKHHPLGKPFMLAEVFCSSQSPLCHQVQKLGELAFRCGLDQGDLSQPATRSWLLSQIAIHRPRHIWYSPVCGPWSSWSHFNAARSELSQQEFRNKRSNLMYQLALGLVLNRQQIQNGLHFHWEPPAGSLMFHQPGLAEIHELSQTCQFDMCTVGGLHDPQNGMPMKKGMSIITTFPPL